MELDEGQRGLLQPYCCSIHVLVPMSKIPDPERPFEATPSLEATGAASAHAEPQALPVVPGYEVLEEIGRGGMGIVYKARQLQLNRIVAVKVIRQDKLAHPESVRRFRREIEAAARMTHPNLVTVYDAAEAGSVHYFSMQFV